MLDLLKRERIVVIVRGVPPASADSTAQALLDGGIRLLEVTMNSENALAVLSGWRERFGESLRVGAGTVLDAQMAREAVSAGAEFLISPNLDEEVIAYGREQGIEVWPGVATPSEIVRAWKAGASAVKVFPLGALGPRYLKEIRGPLSHIPMIAVGGVSLDNLTDFLEAGAVAVGVGGSLVDLSLIREGNFDALRERAEQYVAVAQGKREATDGG